jgi:hypothetical protein
MYSDSRENIRTRNMRPMAPSNQGQGQGGGGSPYAQSGGGGGDGYYGNSQTAAG